MVVQQNSTLTVPGTAAPGAKVSVKADWNGGEATVKADKDGRFSLSLPTPAAGGPFTVVLSDGTGDDLVLSNVLSGEVWLCSGQSNMEMPVEGWGGMGKIMNSDVVVATAQHPDNPLAAVDQEDSSFAEGRCRGEQRRLGDVFPRHDEFLCHSLSLCASSSRGTGSACRCD